MKIPEKLKVGGLVYDVRLIENIDKRSGYLWGRHDGVTSEILIDSDLSTQVKEITFFHEILHALDAFLHLDLDEHNVGRLAHMLHAVLKDNNMLAE